MIFLIMRFVARRGCSLSQGGLDAHLLLHPDAILPVLGVLYEHDVRAVLDRRWHLLPALVLVVEHHAVDVLDVQVLHLHIIIIQSVEVVVVLHQHDEVVLAGVSASLRRSRSPHTVVRRAVLVLLGIRNGRQLARISRHHLIGLGLEDGLGLDVMCARPPRA